MDTTALMNNQTKQQTRESLRGIMNELALKYSGTEADMLKAQDIIRRLRECHDDIDSLG